MQSNKTNNPPQSSHCWGNSSPKKHRAQGCLAMAPQIPCITAPLRQKAPCSGQQVKNNLETHMTWEWAQGQETRGESHSWVTGAVTLQPSGCAGHRRALAESCRWLNPPVLQGEGGSSCGNPCTGAAGPAGSVTGSWEQDGAGGQDPSGSAAPAPRGSARSVPRLEASGFPRPHARLSPRHGLWQAPGSGQAAAREVQQPQGQPVPSHTAPGICPFPTAVQDSPSRGTFCSFLPCRVCGENRREWRLRSRASCPRGRLVSVGAACPYGQEAAACLQPAPLQAQGTEDGPLSQPGPAQH